MKVNCPHCQKATEWNKENSFRPFCCERCKLIDFGGWANDEHKIPGDPEANDLLSGELTTDNVYPFPDTLPHD